MEKTEAEYALRRRRFSFILLLVLVAIGWSLLDYAGYQLRQIRDDVAIEESRSQKSDQLVLASEALGSLAVQDRVSRDGYSRSHFSSGWGRIKGCDMRNRILQRDLDDVVLDDDGCIVLAGTLTEDPFTGKRIPFERGPGTSGDIHIEHLVAVSDAWVKGAQELDAKQRWEFYNDPLNLVAVDGPANMQKGDKDASEWLPRTEYRCKYVARQIAVKLKYYLWVTKSEYHAMRRVLTTCPEQVLPIERPIADP